MRAVSVALLVIGVWLSGTSATLGQEAPAGSAAIVATPAPVFVLPDTGRAPLRTLEPGTRVRVLGSDGDWFRVEFPDPWWGPRVGYIQRRYLDLTAPDLEPPPASGRVQPPTRPPLPPPPARSVARVWIDANGGLAMARTREYALVATPIVHDQTARFQVDHRLPSGLVFDAGAGVMATSQFGVGFTLAGSVQEDTALVNVEIPHPILPGVPAAAAGVTERDLRRRESALHLHGVFVSEPSRELRTRVYAGPTWFRVEQDLVSDITYTQTFAPFEPINTVTVTSATIQRIPYADATGWGFHVGADVSWFLTRALGAGFFGRYSYGTVETRNLLDDQMVKLDVGGLRFGGGLRVRF